MTKILFWNVNKKQLSQVASQICQEYDIDILVLAESLNSDVSIQKHLADKTQTTYIAPFNELSNRNIKFFFRYPTESIQPATDNYGISIREIKSPLAESILVAAVHLSSKLYADDNEQTAQTRQIVQSIEEAEENAGHSRTVVIGDFNMNPFEKGLVDADAFHGVMSQLTARKGTRNVRSTQRKFFYNPMWGRMGDLSEGPPGTYYYQASKNFELFWNTFDQVLLRPGLLNAFRKENLKVITEIGTNRFLTSDRLNKDEFSDHLPIMIELEIELVA
ncbi:MAG: endonuclease/exonuclease/phosphatase family protein [Leptolyngbyaceae cyanobacterium]